MTGQAISLPTTYNFRGLGALPAAGRRTRDGVLYRSDALNLLNDQGRLVLRELRIGTVVDLRDDEEVAHAPSALSHLDVELLRGNVLAGALTRSLQEIPSLTGLYRLIVTQGGPVAVELARTVSANARRDRATLVHCTAGKDRTGVMVAVLLDAVGVDREAIVADYALTEANLAGPWLDGAKTLLAKLGVPLTEEVLQLVGGSPSGVMHGTLEHLDAGFGGAARYLGLHGLGADELDLLKESLLSPGK
ncbi:MULTISPECIES: tyrosine-protein phosphatase [Arthrobacter]|uniref:Tyrosine-protein phosphatase n=2 Tax=Arthrobacter TaxID=1663 RepID=A0ABU9KGY6_9MICC|nr:tyrosine-protein phosphatase [Arthrobacter sp. YJM1]MDP5226164.1 tyrosine-protein phosphatase [Arthrobacter sp. YJM1]